MPDPANYTWELIDKLVRRSMDRVIDHDKRLLVLGPSERAVMHRLAVYIEQDFPGWHVDCEYNRQGDVGDRKQARLAADAPLQDMDPDIIVHLRGTDNRLNLLAIEVKPTSRGAADLEKDRNKLRGYLRAHGYHFAAFVTYVAENEACPYGVERIQLPPRVPHIAIIDGREIDMG